MSGGPRRPASMPRVRSDVLAAELDEDLVLYDPASKSSFRLNYSARAVWTCCDGSSTIDEIAEDLAAVYGADPQTVLAHVRRLVDDWRIQGLLANHHAAPG